MLSHITTVVGPLWTGTSVRRAIHRARRAPKPSPPRYAAVCYPLLPTASQHCKCKATHGAAMLRLQVKAVGDGFLAQQIAQPVNLVRPETTENTIYARPLCKWTLLFVESAVPVTRRQF